MAIRGELYLHEQLLLLTLRDKEGTVEAKAGMYSYALGGALLAQLALSEAIRVGDDKRALVDYVALHRFDDELLDECLRLVRDAKRRRRASAWVSRFAGLRQLRHRAAAGLHRRGVLLEREDQFLLIFKRRVYPTVDPEPERRLLAAMDQAIRGYDEVDSGVAIVVALANATGLLRAHFDRRLLQERKQRLQQITNGELVGGATRAAVQAAQAAAMAAITASIVASSAATSSSC